VTSFSEAAQLTPRRPTAKACVNVSVPYFQETQSATYDAAGQEQNRSDRVDRRHDELRDRADPDGGEADQGGEEAEGTSEGIVGCCGWGAVVELPAEGADGEAEDDGGEEELAGAGDEGGEHVC